MDNHNLQAFRQLSTALWRGGDHAYFWIKNGDKKQTVWFHKRSCPTIPTTGDVYFGVFPTLKKKSDKERAKIEDISDLTALFAEFDAKDYGSLEAALTHIRQLDPPPTALICSGGGYHAYWLLTTPKGLFESSDTAYASAALAHWVEYVGGDKGAKDLARVLRVPGTYNHKYDPPRLVTTIDCEWTRRYELAQLVSIAEDGVGRKLFESVTPAPEVKPIKTTSTDTRYRQYALAALRNVTAELSSLAQGQRNVELYNKAVLLGGYIPHGLLTRSEIEQQLEAAAHSCGLVSDDGLHAVKATVKSGIDNGLVKPLELPQFENLTPSKPSQPQIKSEPVYSPDAFAKMYQSSDTVYQDLMDEVEGKKVRNYEPILLPYTPIHPFGGYAEYLQPGMLVFVVSSAGFGKTAFVDMLRENYSKMGIDSLWDGPEWQPIDMGVRALHRAGKITFREYTQYLLYASDKKKGVEPHKRRGHELTEYVRQGVLDHIRCMRDQWPGKTFYITPEPMQFEQRLALYDYVVKTERVSGRNPRLHFMDYVNLMGTKGDWSELDYRVVAPYQEFIAQNNLVGFIVVQAKRESFNMVKNGGTLDESHLQGLSPQKCKLLIALTPGLSPTGEKLEFAQVTVGKNNTGRTGTIKVKNELSRFRWSEETYGD